MHGSGIVANEVACRITIHEMEATLYLSQWDIDCDVIRCTCSCTCTTTLESNQLFRYGDASVSSVPGSFGGGVWKYLCILPLSQSLRANQGLTITKVLETRENNHKP